MLVTLPVLVGGWSLAGWRQGLWLPGQHCNFFYLLYCHIFLSFIYFFYIFIFYVFFLSFYVFGCLRSIVISFYQLYLLYILWYLLSFFLSFCVFGCLGSIVISFLSNVLHIEFANLSFSWALLGDLKSMHNIRIAHMCDAIIHVASFHT